MEKKDNIYVKLQIEKDFESGGLTLGIYFDKNAPNFSIEKDGMNWSPTPEELDFIVETFDILSSRIEHHKTRNANFKKYETNYNTSKETFDPSVVKNDLNEVEDEPMTPQSEILEDQHTSDKTEEKIFVQANESTIDEAIKRQKDEQIDTFTPDVDEKVIIDKVLKDKIKSKK